MRSADLDKPNNNAGKTTPVVQRQVNPVNRKPTQNHGNSTPVYLQRKEDETVEEETVQNAEPGTEPQIQPKLTIGAPDDKYEQEADRVADTVMRSPTDQIAQPFDNDDERQETPAADIQSKTLIPPYLQAQTTAVQTKSKSKTKPASSASLGAVVNNPSGGSALPAYVRNRVEPVLGTDLGNVKVHNDNKANQAAESIEAKAFTHGNNIFLGKGQSAQNVQLMAHEATHTVQQSKRNTSSVRNKIQRAMKFEYQIKHGSFTNRFYRDDGTNVKTLPRKYGPEDYLVKGESGVTLESETHGQPEFETGWTRSWFELSSQIVEARRMTEQMNAAPKVTGSDGNTYSKFPFSGFEISILGYKYKHPSQMEHLKPGQGFRMSDSRWAKKQKAGKIRVTAEQLNVRTGPGTRFDVITQLFRGDKVKILKTNGKWSQIKKGSINGWVYNSHLRLWKRYESNKDDSGAWSDKPLRAHEQLLVKITDPAWTAYVQASESFSLEQFESFMEQFGNPADVDPAVKDAKSTMSAFNPDSPPPANLLPSDNELQRLFKSAKQLIGKAVSDFKFQSKYSGLKNLLLMVIYYIKMGQQRTEAEKEDSAKFAFHLMSRTNLGSIFKSLSEEEQELFKKMVEDPVRGIAASQGLDSSSKVLKWGHGASGRIPTIQEWLVGITKGKDLLSGGGFPGAMGRFKLEEEYGEQKGLVRFESRRSEPYQVASKWVEHAYDLFATAMRMRPRDSGKGETGLKVGWKEFIKSLWKD